MNETFTEEAPAVEPVIDQPEPPAAMGNLLKAFVALEHRRRELEDELTSNAAEAKRVSEQLLDQFADVGIQNARVDGLTVYVRHDRYVSRKAGIEAAAVCAALRDCGLGYLVADGYNAQSLKAKVAEYAVEGVEVPPALAELLNVGEVPRIATRKA